MKWNTQLLTMRCCVIEGKKFSILSNREKGLVYTIFVAMTTITILEKVNSVTYYLSQHINRGRL